MADLPELIQQAQTRIAPYVVETPLVRLAALDRAVGAQVYVKLENMQNTGSFKLRGAMNKILSLPPEALERGIVAASSGNHGKAVAYACRMLGVPATIVMPHTAAPVKVEAIAAYGATIVRCDVTERFQVAADLCEKTGAALVPPFNDEYIMAGQGTVGLEIARQCPQATAVVSPVSGGGLLGGLATAVKDVMPGTRVFGAEPDAVPRYSVSLAAGKPTRVSQTKSVADALVSNIPGDVCFPHVAASVDEVVAVSDDYLLQAMKLLLMEGKVLAEPSSCIGIGAAMQGLLPLSADDHAVFVISGGSVGFSQLVNLLQDL